MEHNSINASAAADGVSTILYSNGLLEFDVSKVVAEVGVDSKYQGSFNLNVGSGQEVSGLVYASDIRMQTSNQKFSGKHLNVPFIFDSTGMEQGDTACGEFFVVTNVGEFSLPYEVTVKGNVLSGELGEIRNLFHFANLARVNWERAKECFVNPLFADILVGSGGQYAESYKLLLQYGFESGKMDLALDRFLILIHKKQAVALECEKAQYTISKEQAKRELAIEIHRVGWGYTYAEIVSNNGMCIVSEALTNDSFEQDKALLRVKFDSNKLHIGDNSCRLMIKGTERVLCKIVVASEKENTVSHTIKWQNDILKCNMLRLYLDYRTGRRPLKESFKNAEVLLQKTRGIDELLPALYEAHLKLLKDKDNEAIWLLKNAKRMVDKQDVPLEVYGYFLYLLAMSGDDLQQKASDLLNQYAMDNEENFALYWACMHKDNLQYENPAAVYRRLHQFFDEGCMSPILYMEAALLILENELLLAEIDDFEIQVLLFMQRYALLSGPVCERMYQLPYVAKRNCPLFLAMCKKHPSKDEAATAKMMCRLMMKAGCHDEDAASWYKKGIRHDCRINGLYEAYIRALNLSFKETLPIQAVKYFAYPTSLEDRYLAYVYEKVLKQQEDINADYANRIHEFALNQLAKGKINSSLAYLYRTVIMVEDMNADLQRRLQKLVFANELILDQPDKYKTCIVRHKGLKEQIRYSVKKQDTVIFLYNSDYTIMFENQCGDIVEADGNYQLRPFLDYKKVKTLLKDCEHVSLLEQLYLYDKHPISNVEDEADYELAVKRYLWLINQERLDNDFKKMLSAELMYAARQWDMHPESEQLLAKMHADDFSAKDRREYISALVTIGQYDKAYRILSQYGAEDVAIHSLLWICSHVIREETVYDEKILKLAYYVFTEHKYTDEILQYLNLYFIGTHKQMLMIYEALLQMDLPATEIAQRILENVLFTNSNLLDSVDIFRYCQANGVKEDIVAVYLDARANQYLTSDVDLEEDLWGLLNQLLLNGVKISLGAQLAILKYHSKHMQTLSEHERQMCVAFIADALSRDLYLSFFYTYVSLYPVLELYAEQHYVEFYHEKNQKIQLHYVVNVSEQESIYYTDEMKEVYPGIYQKEFRLFWGESIPYYISIVKEEAEQFCEQGILELVENTQGVGSGRYRMVNEIAMTYELSDYEMANRLMEDYELKKYLTSNALKMK